MSEFLQHAVVTLVALAAGWLVLQRTFSAFGQRKDGAPGCPSCSHGPGGCGPPTASASPTPATAGAPAPLTFHRQPRSPRRQ